MIEVVNKLMRTSRHLVQELGREPRPEEIAQCMDIPVAKVRKVLKIMKEPISLEMPVGEEGDSHLSDLIEDRSVVSPAEAVINVKVKEETAHMLHTLSAREEKVVKMRFGLDDGLERTLEEVGQSFALTRECIRQIEAKALRKLRQPSCFRKLEAFLKDVPQMTPKSVARGSRNRGNQMRNIDREKRGETNRYPGAITPVLSARFVRTSGQEVEYDQPSSETLG